MREFRLPPSARRAGVELHPLGDGLHEIRRGMRFEQTSLEDVQRILRDAYLTGVVNLRAEGKSGDVVVSATLPVELISTRGKIEATIHANHVAAAVEVLEEGRYGLPYYRHGGGV